MAHRRSDVLAHAVTLLDDHGLAALTMRRLGSELGVQPSAIYHHFENKQALLAAVADEILARGARPRTAAEWPEQLREVCTELRSAMLAITDGADVVATVWAFGLGVAGPVADLEKVLVDAGASAELAAVAARTLLHYVFGHAFEEQTARQAVSLGAVDRPSTRCPTSTSASTWSSTGCGRAWPEASPSRPGRRRRRAARRAGPRRRRRAASASGPPPTGRRRRGSRRAGRSGRGRPRAGRPGRAGRPRAR